MDTKSSKWVHLVEGGTDGPQYVNMAPMGKTSLGHVTHARKRQKTSFTNLETHGDGSGYMACDTCSDGVPKEIVPAGIVPIGNILVGNNLGVQTRTKGKYPDTFLYVDDIAIIVKDYSELEQLLTDLFASGLHIGMQFNPNKTEVYHFHGPRSLGATLWGT